MKLAMLTIDGLRLYEEAEAMELPPERLALLVPVTATLLADWGIADPAERFDG